MWSTGYKTTRENMTDISNVVNGCEFVDLGLPSGLLWATRNVRVTSPEQTGLYFAWGEIEGFSIKQINKGKIVFDKDKYYSGTVASISKDLTFDNDTANHYMGGKWRTPTKKDWRELLNNCDDAWTNDYNGTGMAGRIFTSKVNGNSVFLPAAGGCYGSSLLGVGSYGNYLSASWYSSSYAWGLLFFSHSQYMDNLLRYFGYSLRGCAREGRILSTHPNPCP